MQQPIDEQQIAAMAIRLLERVELKGAEVPQYVAVSNWLNSKLSVKPVTDWTEAKTEKPKKDAKDG